MFAALAAAAWWAAAQPATDPAPRRAAAAVGAGARHGRRARPQQPLQRNRRRARSSPAVAGALARVYVPNRAANTVSVIDPETLKVIDTYKVGVNPQHVVPSWDLRTLWVANNAEGRTDGSLTPIDPKTGKPGKSIAVDDPYNMYWTPDGKEAIVVAEAYKRLDFRDPQTMKLGGSLADAGLRRHQPCRLLDRRPLRDLHLRVQRLGDQDRPGQPQGAGHDPPEQVLRPARGAGGDRQARQEAEEGARPGRRRRDLHHARHAAGHPHLARRQALLRRRHDGRRRARHRRRDRSSRSASSTPASAPTACTRAATARSSTSPTAAATRSTASRPGRAASR